MRLTYGKALALSKYALYAAGAFVTLRVALGDASAFETLAFTGCVFALGVIIGRRRVLVQLDSCYWEEVRGVGVGDMTYEHQVAVLRRRIAGLLASPRLYLRARRMVAPFDPVPREITEELERLDAEYARR